MVARAAVAAARRAGIAVAPLLAEANLTAAQINDPRASLVARNQARFLDVVARAMGDDLFGFHLAHGIDLRQAGLLYYVIASSATILEGLQRGARFWSIANEGMKLELRAGRHLDLSLQYVGTSRHVDRHQAECWAAMTVRLLGQIGTARVRPIRVRFVHRREAVPGEMAKAFGGEVEFGARIDDVRFERSAGAVPIAGADPYLNKMLVGYCEEALAHRTPKRGSFRGQAENAIVPLLPHGEASVEEVAGRLGLTQRTFARRLAAEGLTFSQLLDRLRLDLAQRYLAEAAISISEIAWLLGYQEVSAFSKAFKRWTGTTPREARAAS